MLFEACVFILRCSNKRQICCFCDVRSNSGHVNDILWRSSETLTHLSVWSLIGYALMPAGRSDMSDSSEISSRSSIVSNCSVDSMPTAASVSCPPESSTNTDCCQPGTRWHIFTQITSLQIISRLSFCRTAIKASFTRIRCYINKLPYFSFSISVYEKMFICPVVKWCG